MVAGKAAFLVLGLLLIVHVGGFFGPGPARSQARSGFRPTRATCPFSPLAIVAVPWFLRTLRGTASSTRNSPGVSSAEEIPRERYARGDLDRTQCFLMLDNLKAESPRKA